MADRYWRHDTAGHSRYSRQALGITAFFVLLSCVIGIQSAYSADYTGGVPKSKVKEALLERGWASSYAEEFSSLVALEYRDLSHMEYAPKAVTYERTPWYTSIVYIDPVRMPGDVPATIEHEMHHLADWRKQNKYVVEEIERDFFSLGQSYSSVRLYSRLPRDYNTVIHYNHDLIYSLDFDYRKLPRWYVDKYFSYADLDWRTPTATPTPIPQRGYRMYIPIGLKRAT